MTKRESLPGVGIIRYRYFGLICSCNVACMSEALSDEQIAVCEKDSVAGLHLLSEKDRRALVEFYVKHLEMGHEPTPSITGELPQ